jgi:hypothetical protein
VTRSLVRRLLAVPALTLMLAPAAFAQDDDPSVLRPAEPDFTLGTLPTGLRVPTMKSAFRVTHRFLRPVGAGDFGDLAGDLFGLDNGAQIGLEYRFGLLPNTQVGIHRTGDKTIEFFGQYSLLRQTNGSPVDVTALAAIDGTNNFKDSYTPVLGAIVSRKVGDVAALYVEPMWLNNTNALPKEVVDDNDTFAVGLGARLRIRPTVYVMGEVTPRASGYKPGSNQMTFAIEKRAGGHVFQFNVSNGFGTTLSQLARGAANTDDWYLGFNLSRKFF